MTIWFTSDLHFSHNNIIKYCKRPTTQEHHNQWIVSTLNKYIKPNDTVYHLGDLSWFRKNNSCEIIDSLSKLNGNWKLIKGNHDYIKNINYICTQLDNFEFVGDYLELKYGGKKLVLFHYPIHDWNGRHKEYIHLHGHTHQEMPEPVIKNRINVCFDVAFRPYDIDSIINNIN